MIDVITDSDCSLPPFIREYFFFLYTWSAHYPYELTHISHAFLPYDADDHRGVYFPAGLQLLPGSEGSGRSLLVSYGKDDNRAMIMRLGEGVLAEYLMPLNKLKPSQYKFCTVGRGKTFSVL